MLPDVPRYLRTMRVHRKDLALRHGRDLIPAQRVRPDVGLVHAEERGDRVPVRPVRDAPLGDPPLDRLGVHVHGVGELTGGLAALEQECPQPLVRHFTHARRTCKDGFTLAGTSPRVHPRSCRVVTAS